MAEAVIDQRGRKAMIGVPLTRDKQRVERPRRRPHPWIARALGAPLLVKLVGANALIVLVAAAILTEWPASRGTALVVLAVALAVSVVANVVLTVLALRPLAALDRVVASVWRGDLDARVEQSLLADRRMRRLADMLNRLLDGLARDRERMRQLASHVIAAQDVERARVARELHDSTAQTLAALNFQLAAAARDSRDAELTERLVEVRALASAVLDEVRGIAHAMHPRVLDDLGLVAALEWLGRTTREHTGLAVTIDGDALLDVEISREVSGVLYRVAQEALGNATRHAGASSVTITLGVERGRATLEVADDGRGFDVSEAVNRRAGMGLFSMRERAALVHGDVTIHSAPGEGTRLVASVPLNGMRK